MFSVDHTGGYCDKKSDKKSEKSASPSKSEKGSKKDSKKDSKKGKDDKSSKSKKKDDLNATTSQIDGDMDIQGQDLVNRTMPVGGGLQPPFIGGMGLVGT